MIRSLTTEENRLVGILGYFIDVPHEDKYLVRGENDWIGPTAATECEVKMWIVLTEGAANES